MFFRCRARLRTTLEDREKYTNDNIGDLTQKIEIVCSKHNHEIITERRKKGSLKKLKALIQNDSSLGK